MPRPGTIGVPVDFDPNVPHAPGANDPDLRLKDLDQEGVWGEVIFPSVGMFLHGHPDIDYAKASAAFGVEGEVVKEPDKLKDAIARARRVIADGRPYLLDVHTWRDGIGAASTWHPPYSVADLRARKV